MAQFLIIPEKEKFPAYKTLSVTLAANEIYTINQTFDAFAVLESSGTMKMSLNEQEESDFDAGIQMRAPTDKAFTTCRIRETAGAAANFRILTSFGDVRDSRFTASGNLNVQNAASPNDELQVKTKAGTTLAAALAAADPAIAALITALREDTLLRSPLTTLVGATFRAASNEATEQTIVASGTNTSGIIVRRAMCYGNDQSLESYFAAGSGQPFVGWNNHVSGGAIVDVIENLFIPAGIGLFSHSNGTGRHNYIWYEVL